MQNLLPIKLSDGRLAQAGFRLKRLEMFNWGTFHGKVERLIPYNRWTLIAGRSGAGKSTAADALRTLLVPPAKVTYNDASADNKASRDRTKKTYIRGVYGTQSQESSVKGVWQTHRQEGEQSIILAVFENEYTGAVVTLAQILWLQNDSYKEHYLIARKDRTISDHLTKLGSGRDVKRTLETNDFELYPSFIAYETKFRHLLGIPGQGALEVFNQVIGVKEVKDINSFIRRHLLEPSDTTNYIAEHLKPHFNELSGCWDAIQRDEAQLERLIPIAQRYAEFAQARATTADLQRVNQQISLFFAQKERDMRIGFDEELEEKLVELRGRKTEIEKLRAVDEEEKLSLNSAITNDEVGQRLAALEREIEEALKSASIKETAFTRLKHQVGILQGTVPASEEQFNQLRQKTLVDKGTFQGNLAAQDQKRMESAITKRELDGQRSRIAVEAESIRNNQVLIPHRLIAIRQQICEDTGLKVTDLPFTGELVEVKDEYRDWTGAVERLLHGFGISLLVPEDRYLTVSKYINAAHLGSRLDFFRVPRGGFDLRTNILGDQRRVPSRLNFKDESPLIHWVRYEITRRFDHFCCEGVQELNQVDFGITKEGLIRNGARHTKDDSARINDRSNFVLGWNTRAKLAALAKELEQVEQKIRDASGKADNAATQMEALRGKIAAADEILKIESFGEINSRPDQETARRLREEHRSLKASNNKVTELQDQLEKCKLRIGNHDTDLDALKNKIGGIDSKREENQKIIVRCRRVLDEKGEPSAETVTWVEGVAKGKELTLETLTDVQGHVQSKLNDQLKKQDEVEKRAERFLLPAMTEFLTAYPEEKADLQASTDYGPDFVKLKVAIEREQLPEHKARFFSKLNTDLLLKIATFGELLENDATNVKTRIEAVNTALRKIEFMSGTYVQITMVSTRSEEVHDFQRELKKCTHGGVLPSEQDLQQIFERIRALINQFDKNPEWTTRVTDARNWLDYGVRRLDNVEDKEIEYYAGSGGKSGGQKSLLAFTILASAITAQYGLAGTADDRDRFRLVVVDEVFGKTDEDFSQRALEMFRKLDLQLVIVNPFDAKARIVDDYVHSYHIVTYREDTSSMKRASRAEYEEARES